MSTGLFQGIAGALPKRPLGGAAFRSTGRPALFLAASVLGATVSAALGDEPPANKPPRKSPLEGVQIQEADDALELLVPARPRTTAEQNRIDALAWYGVGRLKELRNDYPGAYAAYAKAFEYDPNSLAIVTAIVPLAFGLNQSEAGIKYALRAAELDPTNFQLLRRVAVHLQQSGDIEGAIKLLDQATKSPKLEPGTMSHVVLMRDLGLLYQSAKRPKEAAPCLEIVFQALQDHEKFGLDARVRRELQTDPNLQYDRLGQAFLEAENYELALAALEKAVETRRGNPGLVGFNLAQALYHLKQYDRASTELQKYFDGKLQSKGSEPYKLLGALLEAQGKPGELVGRLESMSKDDARNSMLSFYLAGEYRKLKRLDDAEALYKKALEQSNDLEGLLGLAAVYREGQKTAEFLDTLIRGYRRGGVNGDGAAAIAEELKLIKADAALADALLAEGDKRAQAGLEFHSAHVLALIAAETDRVDTAVRFYKEAVKQAGRGQAAGVYEEFAQFLLGSKRPLDAAELLKEAIEKPALQDQRPAFLFLQSQALEVGGKTEEALAAIREARQLIPNNPLLHYQEGWIHSHAQQYPQAIAIFEEIIKTYSGDARSRRFVRQAQFNLSHVYTLIGEMRKGEEILEEIYRNDPNDVGVNNDLGYLYADQGKNLDQALGMIEKALKADPNNAAYLDSMAWVLFKLGRYDEALKYMEKALADPRDDDSTLWDHMGDIRLKLQQPDRALEAWKKALEQAKQSPRPDARLIERLEEKIKQASPTP